MGSPNQPRDWRGRWTVGGRGVAPRSAGNLRSRNGKLTGSMALYYREGRRAGSVQVYNKSRPRVAIKTQQANTVRSYASTSRRRVGAPVGGNKNLRIVATTTKTAGVNVRRASGGTVRTDYRNTTVRTRGRIANRRAARSYNRTGRAPAGTYIVAYNPKG